MHATADAREARFCANFALDTQCGALAARERGEQINSISVRERSIEVGFDRTSLAVPHQRMPQMGALLDPRVRLDAGPRAG
jgi:hypothetical protein